MRTRLLIVTVGILLISTVGISFLNAHAENMFLKDQGLNLSPEECQERYDLFGTHPEPILDLAKFKAENHPVFLQLTEDKSYKLISTGVRSSHFSEHCNTDLPAFQLHYAIGETSGPYTRIYMSLDHVSYDVHEIRTMEIESPWVPVPKSEKLPFYVINWDMVNMEGEYHGHDPQKSSQIFKIPYIANNGKVNSIDAKSGTITADVSFKDEGIFALKIPRNYPYTDHDDSADSGHFFSPLVLAINPTEEIFSHVTKTDCYYDVWMPISGNKTVEVNTTISYLQGDPNHGDSDVPEFCMIKTISDEGTAHLTELSPYKQVEEGISSHLVFCKDGLHFLVKHDGSPACVSYDAQTALWNRDWADKSADIYTKYATSQILDEFNSKLLSEKEALKIVQKFIDETNLVLDASLTNPDFVVTTSLAYVPSKMHAMLSVDPLTGLPTQVVSAELEGFYRTPHWYAELQKDYLGMPSQRIESGNVAWEVNYRTCSMCQDYVTFFVDAISDKIINTRNIDRLFHISDVVLDEGEKSAPLDIASIEDRYIHLNPADMCATVSLELMSPDEVDQTKSGTKDVVFLEFDDNDIEEMPILDELIMATHHLEFPSNEYSKAEMGLRELVDYEFFIMEKAIEKYWDAQEDYFMKFDIDLNERLADSRKQGFSNEFIAPQIVYNDNVYVLGHTVFWVSDEHEMQSLSVHLKENLDESKKFVNLNDEDMESIPKIRNAIEKIGTDLESVVAFKGVPENPDWNDYQEWYANKSAEQFGTEDTSVRGFVYEGEHYELGFMIC